MKTIGMLGGMSWESTAEYYRLANEFVRDRLGGVHSARVLLDSVDFADIETLQAEGRWEEAGCVLADHAAALERAGADLLIVCTNTMHKVADTITAAMTIPLLHIADATAAAIKSHDAAGLTAATGPHGTAEPIRTVGLLGTAFTMEQDFYRDRIADHGIDVIVPEPADRQVVHSIIYEELVRGIVREESREQYRRVIAKLVNAGAQGIILGCTEIELLVGADDSPVPVFPTTRIHVQAAVREALGS